MSPKERIFIVKNLFAPIFKLKFSFNYLIIIRDLASMKYNNIFKITFAAIFSSSINSSHVINVAVIIFFIGRFANSWPISNEEHPVALMAYGDVYNLNALFHNRILSFCFFLFWINGHMSNSTCLYALYGRWLQ